MHAARAAGAIGAKLTGAGGGGAVIALAPGHERDVLARWKAAGFDGFSRRDRRDAAGGARMTAPQAVTAVAGTNIALVKYWGKRDVALNLPATGSLSLTLDRLGTRTTVAFDDGDAAIG